MQVRPFIDPLDVEADSKWPDYAKAVPYIAVVEEGETIVVPSGWWHYVVALDSSVTVMRNFYSKADGHGQHFIERRDVSLEKALAEHYLRRQRKLQSLSDEQLRETAKRVIAD